MTATALKLNETQEPTVVDEVAKTTLFRNKVIMQELVNAADWDMIIALPHVTAARRLLTAAEALCEDLPGDEDEDAKELFLMAYRRCIAAQNEGRPSDQMGRLIFRARAILGMYFGVTD